jgi:hypothetical protein
VSTQRRCWACKEPTAAWFCAGPGKRAGENCNRALCDKCGAVPRERNFATIRVQCPEHRASIGTQLDLDFFLRRAG